MALNKAVHENILFQILKDIYSDSSIAPYLGFKGGTAAFMFYDLERFSVDLDFDLLDESKEEYIFSKVEKIIENYGKIKEARRKRYNLFFLISYQEDAQNIKVEINCRKFGSSYEIKTFLGISMQVMIQKDMFAHKLMAMYERMGKSNRDVFDIWFFAKNNWPINKKIAENRFGGSFEELLGRCIDSLEKMSNRNILDGIGELLNEKQKYWAKTNLISDTIFLLKILKENEK